MHCCALQAENTYFTCSPSQVITKIAKPLAILTRRLETEHTTDRTARSSSSCRHSTETHNPSPLLPFDPVAAAAAGLPRVELLFSYPGSQGPLLPLPDATAGIVVVTTSSLSPSEKHSFAQVRQAGVVIVTCFPTGGHLASGVDRSVTKPDEDRFETSDHNIEQTNPIIRAQHLLPAKARILLMLALAVTKDPTDLQRIFSEY